MLFSGALGLTGPSILFKIEIDELTRTTFFIYSIILAAKLGRKHKNLTNWFNATLFRACILVFIVLFLGSSAAAVFEILPMIYFVKIGLLFLIYLHAFCCLFPLSGDAER